MAPKPTSEETARRNREARAKKLLIALIPLLAILAVWQGPKVLDQLSSATEKTKAKTQNVQGKVVQGFAELSPNGTVTTSATPASPAELVSSGSLQDTDPAPEAEEGELISFTRFSARDPFVQLVDDQATSEGSGEGSTSSSSSGSTSTGTSGSSGPTTTTTIPDDTSGATQTQATIRVNGVVVTVSIGETFPESDPAFTLVAIEGGVAKIGLVSGAFSNGAQTLDLEVGDSVTLISQPDGARFTLKLIEIG
jgi:hypothetical protein